MQHGCGVRLFVWLPDDRGLIVVRLLIVLVFILLIIVTVRISWRRAAYGEDASVDQPDGNAVGGACDHVSPCRTAFSGGYFSLLGPGSNNPVSSVVTATQSGLSIDTVRVGFNHNFN
jgi:hypothetical protein